MRFEFIRHDCLNPKLLNQIIELKARVWNYSYEEHHNWIKKNIGYDDIHLLVWEGSTVIGYLNMVKISGTVDAWGIGNVVVHPSKQKQNIGLLLMNICDFFLAKTNTPGLLICKDQVAKFYSVCGWKDFPKEVWLNDGSKLLHHLFTRRLKQDKYDYLKINRLF